MLELLMYLLEQPLDVITQREAARAIGCFCLRSNLQLQAAEMPISTVLLHIAFKSASAHATQVHSETYHPTDEKTLFQVVRCLANICMNEDAIRAINRRLRDSPVHHWKQIQVRVLRDRQHVTALGCEYDCSATFFAFAASTSIICILTARIIVSRTGYLTHRLPGFLQLVHVA